MASPRTVLFSLSDKSGSEEFALGLERLGCRILATGSTAQYLRDAGATSVTEVSEYTGFPEMLGGRVKTLHPRIHAGILAPGTPEGLAELAAHGLDPIDMVVVNLYPFEETLTIEGVSEAELIEQIDIGGPTLLRAAAKNFARVAVVVDPADYGLILEQLEDEGELSEEIRRELAVKVFDRVAAYDIAIANWLRATTPGPASEELPDRVFLSLRRIQPLRYGENPHQQAALYRERGSHPVFYDGMEVLQGKELSYNNLLDISAALDLIGEFPGEPAAVVIKHGNPAGMAIGATLAESFQLAWNGDPIAAFGGVIALGAPVDGALAEQLAANFVEVIVAPDFDAAALEALGNKKNLRVIRLGPNWHTAQVMRYQVRSTPYGLLVQDWDRPETIPLEEWTVATTCQPTTEQMEALEFAWRCARHVMSNAIVLVQGRTLVGAGAGQQSRLKSWKLAAEQAGDRARGSVAASDAFLPFEDNVELALAAGVSAIIQPGGSVRDPQVIAAAEAAGIPMVLTGVRHFRH